MLWPWERFVLGKKIAFNAAPGRSGILVSLCQPALLSIAGVPRGSGEWSLEREGLLFGSSAALYLKEEYVNSAFGLFLCARDRHANWRQGA